MTSNQNQVKTAIIGAGPIGSILATKLSLAGHSCCLVDIMPELIKAIQTTGLQVNQEDRKLQAYPQACSSIKDLAGGDIDYLFICVKANALPKIVELLRATLKKKTNLISFQNGIDTEEVIAAQFPRNWVFRVVANFAGMMIEPGLVKMTFFHPPNYIGCLAPESIDKAKELAAILSAAELNTQYVETIKKEVWRKAILNSCLMPVSVITGLTMSSIMNLPETRMIVETLLKELLEIAAREGHTYEPDFFQKALQYLDTAGDHKPSMLMDFLTGRPLEIDFLNGKFQEYADKHHVNALNNRICLSLIKGLLLNRDNLAKAKKNG